LGFGLLRGLLSFTCDSGKKQNGWKEKTMNIFEKGRQGKSTGRRLGGGGAKRISTGKQICDETGRENQRKDKIFKKKKKGDSSWGDSGGNHGLIDVYIHEERITTSSWECESANRANGGRRYIRQYRNRQTQLKKV